MIVVTYKVFYVYKRNEFFFIVEILLLIAHSASELLVVYLYFSSNGFTGFERFEETTTFLVIYCFYETT